MLLSLLPQPPDFAPPVPLSVCVAPLPQAWSDPAPHQGAGRTPPRGMGFAGRSLSLGGASRREAEVLSSFWPWEKVTLPFGDICIYFLTPPNKAFPLGGSCYSPDGAPSLFRMGAVRGLSPGPPCAPVPTVTPLVCCWLSGLGQPHVLKITWATPNPRVGKCGSAYVPPHGRPQPPRAITSSRG